MYVRFKRPLFNSLLLVPAALGLVACGAQPSTTAPVVTSRSATKPTTAEPGSPLAQLALVAHVQTTQPVQMSIAITDTLSNAHVQTTAAIDPVNNESDSTTHVTLSGIAGANSVSIVAQTIRIGQHYWGKSTPPGGGWHQGTVSYTNPFPLGELLPYIVDVHTVAGRLIRGHSTQGLRATLDKRGVRVLESFGTGNAISPAQQIIMSMVFTLWIGAAHHIRALNLAEDCVQNGHSYQVFEKAIYYRWGRGLHLVSPVLG
ncbi:MAG: hypothetical protein ACYDHP_09865 [Ferrimicrobium sp.]